MFFIKYDYYLPLKRKLIPLKKWFIKIKVKSNSDQYNKLNEGIALYYKK